jgi:ligand-binding sensor domain-containing protein/two-component sensor histidine kinase
MLHFRLSIITHKRPTLPGLPTLVTCFLLLFDLVSPAQTDNFQRTYLTTQDGLSQNYVYCILQDKRGFMWFGTRNGLNRYDGYNFKVYNHEPFDNSTISHNLIRCMVEDDEGNLWLGTHGGGLNRLDKRREKFICFRKDPNNPKSLTHDMINALFLDKEGKLWIGTRGGGLCVIDAKAVNRTIARGESPTQNVACYRNDPRNPQSLGSDVVMGILRDDKGVVWITTNRVCDRFVPSSGNWTHFAFDGKNMIVPVRQLTAPVLSNYITFDLLLNQRSNLFLAVDGLSVFDESRNVFICNPAARATVLAEDYNGDILLGHRGLTVLRKNGVIDTLLLTNPPAGASPQLGVMSLFVDSRHSIWAGTTGGIVRIDRSRDVFHYLPFQDAKTGSVAVRTLVEDSRGNIWAGTVNRGVLRCNTERSVLESCTPTPCPIPSIIPERIYINTAMRTSRGELMFGHGTGVWSVSADGSRFLRIGYDRTDFGQTIWGRFFSLLEDSRGNIWGGVILSGKGFLYRIDGKAGTLDSAGYLQREIHRRSGSGVWKIFEDHKHRLWFGTSKGVIRFDPVDSSIRQYDHEPSNRNSLAHNEVWEIFEDSRHTLWIGTMGGGLDRFDEQSGRFIHHTVKNGLADNVVKSILEDRNGHLWIGTDNGVSHFDPRAQSFRNYNTNEIRKAGAIATHAGIVLRDGSFLFGAEFGVLRFHPDSVRDDPMNSPLAFTGLSIQGRVQARDVLHGDTITLQPGDNYVSLEFASLDFRNNKQLRYAFMLDGATHGWVDLGRRRNCSFADIPHGTHELRIKGTNSDGVWNNAYLAVTIVVLPPFYLRWWFLYPLAFLLLSSAGVGIRWRINAIRKRANHDRRLVESELKALRLQINPHFFFNSLNAIQGFVLSSDDEQANTYISKFARLMRSVLENSRAASVSIVEEIETLKLYMELEALRFKKRFAFRIDVAPEIDMKQHIPSMLIQPYVENAVRHGLQPLKSGGLLVVSLSKRDDTIVCIVEDNGIGRERALAMRGTQDPKRKSLGMSITQERLDILNSMRKKHLSVHVTDLHLPDGVPSGTRVEIEIPLEEG